MTEPHAHNTNWLDEIERLTVDENVLEGPWHTRGRTSFIEGEAVPAITGRADENHICEVGFDFIPEVRQPTADLIVALRNNATELIRLARLGQQVEAQPCASCEKPIEPGYRIVDTEGAVFCEDCYQP